MFTGSEFEMDGDPGVNLRYNATCHLLETGEFVILRSYED